MGDMKYCHNLSEKLDPKVECCGSCHSDYDEGYGYLILIEHKGVEYKVCCALHEALKGSIKKDDGK